MKSRKLIKKSVFGCVAVTCLLTFVSKPSFTAPVSSLDDFSGYYVTLRSNRTYSRLVIPVESDISVKLSNKGKGFEILLEGVGFFDFGVPLGKEGEWIDKVSTLNDSRLESIKAMEVPEGIKLTGKWKFPKGENAPAYPEMIHFDYQQSDPSRYVIDFWVKDGPTVAQVKREKQKRERLKSLLVTPKSARLRQLASESQAIVKEEKKKIEIYDIRSFCKKPISEDVDIFLKFRPIHEEFDFSRWFSSTTPDFNYQYEKPNLLSTKRSKDGEYFSLAVKLYQQGKPALAMRTVDFLQEEFPESPLNPKALFLKANASVRLGLNEKAEKILGEIIINHKSSEEALHAMMFRAGVALKDKEYHQALQHFMWLITNHPKSEDAWLFNMGAAESHFKLKQTDMTLQRYQWIIENAPGRLSKAEAGLRLGDVYMDRFHYSQALASYYKGGKYFRFYSKKFPSLHINRAEALYWLKQYDRAEVEFKKFLKSFPNHPSGWRATFRLAEIELRRNGETKKSKSWLYKTVNRYPYSPGATLARLRIMPCGDHGGYDFTAAQRFFQKDAVAFEKSTEEVIMDGYKDFLALSHVRALTAYQREDEIVKVIAEKFKLGMGSLAKSVLSDIFEKAFRNVIIKMVTADKGYEALVFFEKYHKVIDEKSGRIGSEYLAELAEAASNLGFGKLSEKFLDLYKTHSKSGRTVAAVPISKRFLEAKSLWIQNDEKRHDEVVLLLKKVPDSSQYSFEKYLILGLIDEKNKMYKSALEKGVKAQFLHDKSHQSESYRVLYWIGTLQAKLNESEIAIRSFRKVRENYEKIKSENKFIGLPKIPSYIKLLYAETELLEKRGEWSEAASVYRDAMKKYLDSNQLKYRLARALMNVGGEVSRKEAEKILKEVAEGKEDDFWRKLASETLATEERKRRIE